jgi:hypothetical protein
MKQSIGWIVLPPPEEEEEEEPLIGHNRPLQALIERHCQPLTLG